MNGNIDRFLEHFNGMGEVFQQFEERLKGKLKDGETPRQPKVTIHPEFNPRDSLSFLLYIDDGPKGFWFPEPLPERFPWKINTYITRFTIRPGTTITLRSALSPIRAFTSSSLSTISWISSLLSPNATETLARSLPLT